VHGYIIFHNVILVNSWYCLIRDFSKFIKFWEDCWMNILFCFSCKEALLYEIRGWENNYRIRNLEWMMNFFYWEEVQLNQFKIITRYV